MLSESDGWNRILIDPAFKSGDAVRADLAASGPVHILSLTAGGDGTGDQLNLISD